MNENGITPPKGLEANDQQYPRLYKWLQLLHLAFPKVQTFSVTINPASVAAQTTSEQGFIVNGLTTTDIVTVSKPTHSTGLGIVNCRVSAANTLQITFMNATAAPIDPPSEIYLISSIRR